MTSAAAVSEKDFQATLVAALEVFGYVVEHTYPLMTKGGFYRTGSTLKGKPDLIAVRPPRLLAIECKVAGRKPEPEQVAVLSLYSVIPSARAWVLRETDDWDMVVSWLRRPKEAPAAYGFEPIVRQVAPGEFEGVAEARRLLAAAGRRGGGRRKGVAR